MLLLENKIADVTGGSSGIGLATAQRFVEQGAYVFIAGHRPVEIDKAVAEIGHNVTGVEPTSPSSMTSTVFMRPSRGRARSTCFSRARPSSKRR